MKSLDGIAITALAVVAPFMGAWIEIISPAPPQGRQIKSHPLWVRGLKYKLFVLCPAYWCVAPFMGAWIEIPYHFERYSAKLVAPFMGAWIEIVIGIELLK